MSVLKLQDQLNYITDSWGEANQGNAVSLTVLDKFNTIVSQSKQMKNYLTYLVQNERLEYCIACTVEYSQTAIDMDSVESLASRVASITDYQVYYNHETWDGYSEVMVIVPLGYSLGHIESTLEEIENIL